MLKSWVSFRKSVKSASCAGATAAFEIGTVGRPQHGGGGEELPADPHRMRLIARRHDELRWYGLESFFDDVAADANIPNGFIDDRTRLAEDLARFGDLTTNADGFKDRQSRFMQHFDLVIGDELGGWQWVDKLLPRHLGNGSPAAIADASPPLRLSRLGHCNSVQM